ncbi:MAG: DUF11 domain-containing protein [Bacteroidetes bacterium]|nr:DUF11 domain-containing protein [Bacteroidota bacterium]
MKSLLVAISKSHHQFSNELLAFLVFLLCVLVSFSSHAQSGKGLSQVNDYLAKNKASLGFTTTDIADITVKDSYIDAHNGVSHVYVQQRYNGIEIKDAILGLHTQKTGELLFVGNTFQKKIDTRLAKGAATFTAVQAVQVAAQSLDLQAKTKFEVLKNEAGASQRTLLSKGGISQNEIPVKLVYVQAEDGSLHLVWEVEIYTLDAQHYYVTQVDARSGKVLGKQDMVVSCNFDHSHSAECGDHGTFELPSEIFSQENGNISSLFEANPPVAGNFYRVYNAPTEAPSFGNRTLVNTSGDPFSSPLGWHYDGYVPYNITKGNNVYAYEDKNGVGAGASPSGGLPGQQLFFDFPINFNNSPTTYTNAAVTNLFFWNNYVHDVMYRYGFTEPAGNFQFNNLNKGGVGLDAVLAEAQDGGGTNNANFLTLPDGVPGRMQMYLWTSNSPAEMVRIQSSPTYPNGNVNFTAIQAAFGPAVSTTAVSGQLVIAEANQNIQVSCTNDCGCGTGQGVGLPPNNNVVGKIVLIDRGSCTFIEKVMGAQLGGAAGVIVVNNVPGDGPIAMGGDAQSGAPAIIIPSVMVSYEDGLELKDELALGNVTIALQRLVPAPPNKDGDLDNGIIAHEYGHGISTRLTGGPGTTCLSGDEQAGEGWSDFFAMMLTMKPQTVGTIGATGRGMGTYVFDEPTTGLGIRPARYSTDMAVNSYTYGDINNAEIAVPHGVGFIFATALWEMAFKLIDHYGFDSNINSGDLTKGNILALQLVIDGLKLQPCSPTFLQSRDAILAADVALTGGANQCMIWEAFAKRGMGYSAVSGTNSRGDEIEAFDMPPSCLANVKIVKTAAATVNNGQQLTYTLTVTNLGALTATGVVVTDPLPAGTNYVAGSASNNGSEVNGVVTYPIFNLNPGATAVRTFNVMVNTPGSSNLQFFDNMEDGINQWTPSVGLNAFTYSDVQRHSGNYVWFATDPDNASNQTLDIASEITLPANAQLRFWHKFETESSFDGGVVELSNDGGLTWINLGAQITQNGYNDFVPAANNPLINGFAFGGSSNGWIESVVNLGTFANQSVIVRFRFSSDFASGSVGWAIDDVVIGTGITQVTNTVDFVAANNLAGSSSVTTMVLTPGQNIGTPTGNNLAQPQAFYNSKDSDLQVTAFPNPAKDVVNLKLDGEVSGSVTVQIMSAQGQLLRKVKFAAEEISPVLALGTGDLATGMYLVSLSDDAVIRTVKVFIQKD